MVAWRDGVRANTAIGRRQVDGEPGRGDDALVVVRALPDVAFDKRRGGRGVGHGAGVGGVAAVRGRGLPATAAGADLRAVRARFGARARASKVLAVSVRVGERGPAAGRGDVATRIAGTTAARQHGRRGVLLVLVRVGRRRTAFGVLSRHGGEYVGAVHGFQPVGRGYQLDGRRRRVHLGDERRRGRRRAVYRPAVVLWRMVSTTVLFFHAAHSVVVVVRLLVVVVVHDVNDQLLLLLILLTAVAAGRDQHHFGTSSDRFQTVRIVAALVRWSAAAVMAQVLGLALKRLVQEKSLQVAQVSGADFQSSWTRPDKSVGWF